LPSTGNVFPTVAASVDRAAATAWTNPGNVVSDNASDATVVVPSDYLVCSSFGFVIPDMAVITGVTLRAECSESGTGTTDPIAQLITSTTPTLIGTTNTWNVSGTGKVIATEGGVNVLWGTTTLTPAVVKDPGFGVAIWATDTTNTLAIDFVTLAVEFAFPDVTFPSTGWAVAR